MPKAMELKFLSRQNELKVRQLRAFAATIGATADKYSAYDKLMEALESSKKSVVIVDSTVDLTVQQLNQLYAQCPVFIMIQKSKIPSLTNEAFAPYQPAAAVCLVDHAEFLASPITRFCIRQTCQSPYFFSLQQMFGWGYCKKEFTTIEGPILNDQMVNYLADFSLNKERTHLFTAFNSILMKYKKDQEIDFQSLSIVSDGLYFGQIAKIKVHRHNPPPLGRIAHDIEQGKLHRIAINVSNDYVEVAQVIQVQKAFLSTADTHSLILMGMHHKTNGGKD